MTCGRLVREWGCAGSLGWPVAGPVGIRARGAAHLSDQAGNTGAPMGQDRSISVDEAKDVVGRACGPSWPVTSGRSRCSPRTSPSIRRTCGFDRGPSSRTSSATGLGALTNVELAVADVEVVESGVVATWSVSGDHTGEVLFNEDELFEASGRRIQFSAQSTFEFRAGLISALRTDYDDMDLYRQISEEQAPLRPPGGPARGVELIASLRRTRRACGRPRSSVTSRCCGTRRAGRRSRGG